MGLLARPHLFSVKSIGLTLTLGSAIFGFNSSARSQTIDPAHLAGLKWRNVGPFRGGRVSAVAGVISQPDVFYIGLPQGGVWKTTSAGQTWYPVFDAIKDTSCVGSVQVAQSDPNVIYAGTGEISGGGEGTGVYRSSDAGRTWTKIGLGDSKLVPALLIDPKDSNLVLAAATGSIFEASKGRGVFRTVDGGKTWKNSLSISEDTGVQHLAWAYDNPSVIFASSMSRYGAPVQTPSGPKPLPGPELYKTTDEGVTWKKLAPTGLPKLSGRICVAVAQGTHSQRVFLIGTFGLYRSDDGGQTWRQMAADDSRIANGQGAYTSGVYVDPSNPDIVYTLATCVYRSIDGGKTFTGFKGAPGGDDPQQMWLDPSDHTHILLGGDQGAVVSLDAGKTWGSWYNQPTGQVYHVSTDNRFPYWVYATQQDSGCIGVSSRGNLGAITPMDWTPHPGNEGGYVIVDPLNPNISYAVGPVGGMIRVTNPSGQWTQVEPDMSPESGLRGGSGQMMFSPTNPHELLASFQYLMSTTDGGAHWKKLSPDLATIPNPKTQDEKNMAQFASIMSFSVSPVKPGLIWAGTSSGFIKVTRDHGNTWEDVSLPRRPSQKRIFVRCVEASGADPRTAYAILRGIDQGPNSHIYRTHDFGQTWTRIANGFKEEISTIRSDPQKPGLLFGLGGRKIFVSLDDGDTWQDLNLNLPTTQCSDIVIHGNDLVLGTFGRGIWILDDYSVLRQISAATVKDPIHLYKPSDAYRLQRNVNGDTPFPIEVPHAENPPLGAVIYYSLANKPAGEVKIEILDNRGKVIRHYSSNPIAPYDDPAPLVPNFWMEDRKPLPTEVGLNRINWNVRLDTPLAFTHDVSDVMGAIAGDTPAAIEGPLAVPGDYTIRLTVDGKSTEQTVTIKNDPRSLATTRDIHLENAFRLNYLAAIQETWDGVHQVDALRQSIAALIAAKPADNIAKTAKALDDKLANIGGTVTHQRRFYGPPQPTNFVGINGFLLARLDSFDYGDMAPNEPMLSTYGSDWAKLKAVSDDWRSAQKKDLAALNTLLTKSNLPALKVVGPTLVDPPAPDRRYIPKAKPAQSMPAFAVPMPTG